MIFINLSGRVLDRVTRVFCTGLDASYSKLTLARTDPIWHLCVKNLYISLCMQVLNTILMKTSAKEHKKNNLKYTGEYHRIKLKLLKTNSLAIIPRQSICGL